MSTCLIRKNPSLSPATRQLVQRHFRQIIQRPQAQHDQLCRVYAITFLPGNRTSSFRNQAIRPLGLAKLVCLSYGMDTGSGQRTMPIRGVHAQLDGNGTVSYCATESALFLHDAALPPSVRSSSSALNPARNPSLTALAQRMDRACERQLACPYRLSRVVRLPRILFGFSPASPPAFEDTSALRKLAARELQLPVDQLGADGEPLLQRYLRDLWEQQLIWPANPNNPTGSLLVDAELCTRPQTALRAYEDFSELLGVPTWNPARQAEPQLLANPAGPILERFGIHDLNQPISDEQLADLESAVRQAVGVPVTQEEVYDAIANQALPLRAWSPVLPQLRSLLEPSISQCTSDEDLLRAASNPQEPLVASGACRIQILARRAEDDQVAFAFSSEQLGRRARVNLHLARWSAR